MLSGKNINDTRITSVMQIVSHIEYIFHLVGLLRKTDHFSLRATESVASAPVVAPSSLFMRAPEKLPPIVSPDDFIAPLAPEITEYLFQRICANEPFKHAFTKTAFNAFMLKYKLIDNRVYAILFFSKIYCWMPADFSEEILHGNVRDAVIEKKQGKVLRLEAILNKKTEPVARCALTPPPTFLEQPKRTRLAPLNPNVFANSVRLEKHSDTSSSLSISPANAVQTKAPYFLAPIKEPRRAHSSLDNKKPYLKRDWSGLMPC